MGKYHVTVVAKTIWKMTVRAGSEAEAKEHAIEIVSNPGQLDDDTTIPEQHDTDYSATAKPAA